MSRVELVGIEKRFGAMRAVADVSLAIEAGTLAAILGPSGCGKTTLLRLVAGLEQPSAGRIEVGGEDITALPPERRGLGMMFQSYALLPHMTVAENLRFPLRMQRIGDRRAQLDKVGWALELVQLTDMAARFPRQLSGGQQQRVALARALIAGPRVLLLDEPLSNLDAQLRKDMQLELIELHRKLKLTTLLVTHDQEEALSLADVVVLMREGGVEQTGTPRTLYDEPLTPFAARFLGAANLLEVDARPTPGGAWQVEIAAGVSVLVTAPADVSPGPRTLMLRQEDIVVSAADADGIVRGELGTVAFQGATCRAVVHVAGQRLHVIAPSAALAGFESGQPVQLDWPNGKAVLL